MWNTMGGIDWAAFPILCEIYGVVDVELIISQLVTIREYKKHG
jgi:hypothetical protein